MVKIVETVASSVTSTKQHIWCGAERCEERDGSGSPSKQFFSRGQINSSTNYFYSKDHLGSIRALTDDNGDVQAAYSFDSFGVPKKLEGAQDSDFQFAGYFLHARSGLDLTVHRAYSPTFGRFINRDPIEEESGANLFEYVSNDPISLIDPMGLYECCSDDACCERNRAECKAKGGNPVCCDGAYMGCINDKGRPGRKHKTVAFENCSRRGRKSPASEEKKEGKRTERPPSNPEPTDWWPHTWPTPPKPEPNPFIPPWWPTIPSPWGPIPIIPIPIFPVPIPI